MRYFINHFHVFILAAGNGIRFLDNLKREQIHNSSFFLKKQFLQVNKIPLYLYSLFTFLKIKKEKNFSLNLYLICHEEDQSKIQEDLNKFNIDNVTLIKGGKTRFESVYRGFKFLHNTLSINEIDKHSIIVHDSTRPVISREEILLLLNKLKTHRSVSYYQIIEDSLKQINNRDPLSFKPFLLKKENNTPLNREHVIRIQTPQGFHLNILKKAYQKILFLKKSIDNVDITEETQIISNLGIHTCMIKGSKFNIKLTDLEDFIIIQNHINNYYEYNQSRDFKNALRK